MNCFPTFHGIRSYSSSLHSPPLISSWDPVTLQHEIRSLLIVRSDPHLHWSLREIWLLLLLISSSRDSIDLFVRCRLLKISDHDHRQSISIQITIQSKFHPLDLVQLQQQPSPCSLSRITSRQRSLSHAHLGLAALQRSKLKAEALSCCQQIIFVDGRSFKAMSRSNFFDHVPWSSLSVNFFVGRNFELLPANYFLITCLDRVILSFKSSLLFLVSLFISCLSRTSVLFFVLFLVLLRNLVLWDQNHRIFFGLQSCRAPIFKLHQGCRWFRQ